MDEDKEKDKTPVETTPPNGIKGVALPESWWTPEHVAMIVIPLLLVLGLLLLVLVWLGRRRAKAARSADIPRDPWRDLGEFVRGLAEPSDDAWQQFASDVSVAARKIIGDASLMPCEDWTTDEFARKMHELPVIEGLPANDVLILLRETDLIRFAGRHPEVGMAAQWIKLLQSWYRIQDQRRHTPTSVSVPSSLSTSRGEVRVFD